MRTSLRRLHASRGFTLIELLVVILIIGILAAVALPSFLGQTNKAKDSEVKQELALSYKNLKAYAASNDSKFPSTTTEATAEILKGEPQLAGKISDTATPASGKLGVCVADPTQVKITAVSGSGTKFTMAADQQGAYTISQGGCLNYADTVRRDASMYYPMDNAPGASALSEPVSGQRLQLNSAFGSGQAPLLGAPALVGTGSSVQFRGQGIYEAPTTTVETVAYTIEAWIKVDSLASFGTGFDNSSLIVGNFNWAGLSMDRDGVLYAKQFLSSSSRADGDLRSPAGAITAGKVYHIVMTESADDRGDGSRMYVNGKLVASRGSQNGGSRQANATVQMGAGGTGGGPGFLGFIDNVGFYPKELTADQVADHYALGTTPEG